MKRIKSPWMAIFVVLGRLWCGTAGAQQALRLNALEYVDVPGLNVMALQDIYPEGHQAGVTLMQNRVRVATNGDLRPDPTRGQWQPMPQEDKRVVTPKDNEITTWLSYPDPSRNRTGFSPID